MSTTKAKILSKALELFNTSGITDVSLRQIADSAGISVGNLQYHFNKREEIIEALYFQIVERIDLLSVEMNTSPLNILFEASGEVMKIFMDYRFFLMDFVVISRQHPKIKAHYANLSVRRANQFLMIINGLIEIGLVRSPILENEYEILFERIEIISNFWFSSILIHEDKISDSAIEGYKRQIQYCLYPYLTDDGKREIGLCTV